MHIVQTIGFSKKKNTTKTFFFVFALAKTKPVIPTKHIPP
jgi:hypothetical protein